MHDHLGRRVLVWGNSCAGKSTLAQRLADDLHVPHVELDALNWLPNWVGLNATNPDLLVERFVEATKGDAWIVSGSYTAHAQRAFWPRLETIIWLDFPLPLLVYRVITRSWRRWWNRELLWGTNYENFWRQLQVWRGEDSLVWWVVTQHRRKRRQTLMFMADPQWAHIKVLRFTSPAQVEAHFSGTSRRG